MPDFDKLLEGIAPKASDAFSAAAADLNALVSGASIALRRHTGGRALLKLTPIREGLDVLYALSLQVDNQGPVLEGLLVGARGYPIAAGQIMDLPSVPVLAPGTRKEFRDKEELDAHFTELFSSDASPLLIHLGSLLRRQ